MESNLSNAPFFIGQEVVALRDDWTELKHFKKGNVFTVLGVKKFCKHGYTIKINILFDSENYCPLCDKSFIGDGFRWASAKAFAPVSRLRISDKLTIAADLFQTKPVEERADVIIPETIQN